ncbi:MAG: efflux RND transporter periplasmic adaptor subunit [candidate division Zixibacteria bacterium]|nr:efflux RND transporter periplasmic adaptor subunit [candidate division Zixibacteria bacterium]
MRLRSKIIIGVVAVVGIGGMVWAGIRFQRKQTVPVQTQKVETRALKARVSASGKIETTRKVDVSASISGKVVQLNVREGQTVEKGQLLLQIDPTPTQTTVAQLQASIRSAKANLSLSEANLRLAQSEYDRQKALFDRGMIAEDAVQRALSGREVEQARNHAAREEISRLEASLRNAQHDLTKVNMIADISGIVTKLNIEEGENAFVGTFNNPGTVLLTISDLSHIEAWVEVDETDVVSLRVGQPAEIVVDAYPDTVFNGVIDRIGNSPITVSGGADRQAVNFEVVILLTDTIPLVRPGLSCVADMITGVRSGVLSIPIQALTIREPGKEKTGNEGTNGDRNVSRRRNRAYEGVFVVDQDRAIFRRVLTGLTGEQHFEVLTGLRESEEIVIGPFETLRTLKDSTLVTREQPK